MCIINSIVEFVDHWVTCVLLVLYYFILNIVDKIFNSIVEFVNYCGYVCC